MARKNNCLVTYDEATNVITFQAKNAESNLYGKYMNAVSGPELFETLKQFIALIKK